MHDSSLNRINSTPRYTSPFRCPARETDALVTRERAVVRYRLVPIRPVVVCLPSSTPRHRAVSISAASRRSLYKLISRYVLIRGLPPYDVPLSRSPSNVRPPWVTHYDPDVAHVCVCPCIPRVHVHVHVRDAAAALVRACVVARRCRLKGNLRGGTVGGY